MSQFQLTIATPERQVYQDQVESLTVPTTSGQITVLPHHMPISTVLSSGEMIIRKGQAEEPYAVSGGFLEVQPTKVVVLADTAEHVTEIDEQRAEEARERAKKLMDEKRHDVEEFANIAAKLERDLNRLHVVRKYRHRSHQGITQEAIRKE